MSAGQGAVFLQRASLRQLLPVLLNKEPRRADLEPDYFGFRSASNSKWIGYGLTADNGVGLQLACSFVTSPAGQAAGAAQV